MNGTNCTNTHIASPNEVSGQSLLWGVITLAMNAMQQPSILEGNGASGFMSWTRASPLVCILDILAAFFVILANRSDSTTWRGALKEYMAEYGLNNTGSNDASTKSIAGVLFFTLGVVPQALKIFSMQGVVFTQILCGCYFSAALLSNLLNLLNSANDSYFEVSAPQREGRGDTIWIDRVYSSDQGITLGLFIAPSFFWFMIAPGYLHRLKEEERDSGRFYEPTERFSYGTVYFLGLSLMAIILWLAGAMALRLFTTDQRLYRLTANVQFGVQIITFIMIWIVVTLMLSTLGLISGIIMAITEQDPWMLLALPMVTIHVFSWVALGVTFPLVFFFCFAVFVEILRQWLEKSRSGSSRLDQAESGSDNKAYIWEIIGRCACPVFGLLHLFFFALVYLGDWDGSGTKKPAWTDFLG